MGWARLCRVHTNRETFRSDVRADCRIDTMWQAPEHATPDDWFNVT